MSEFVTRSFALGDQEITCAFRKPVPESNAYRCDYRIGFPSGERAFFGRGIDEVQALLNAMTMAHADILASDEYRDQGLNWLGMRDLGLPPT